MNSIPLSGAAFLKKRVCIISLALPIEVDPRTSRQAVYLARDYEVTLIGYGTPPSDWHQINWRPVHRQTSKLQTLFEILLLIAGRIFPFLYDFWFDTRSRYNQALNYALESKANVYHASDWATLVLCVKAARQLNARVFFDADEYWPLENESNPLWRIFFSPLIAYTLHQYAGSIDAATTVSQPIAQRYKNEYNIDAAVLLNVPDYEEISPRAVQANHIRLLHHGASRRNRYLETMIEALALAEPRFTLHLMLMPGDPGYLESLKELAQKLVPGRVEFRPVVHPFEIVRAISDCHIGICLIPPTTYTYLMTLPNKLFEFLIAGMAVVNGPSPAMAEIVQQYQVGWVLPSFEAKALANQLNILTIDDIEFARTNARAAAKILNAQVEYAKLLSIYQNLLEAPGLTVF